MNIVPMTYTVPIVQGFIFLAYADTILLLSGFDYFLVISASRSLSQLLVIYTDFSFL